MTLGRLKEILAGDVGRRFVIGVPYAWLLAFFVVPFLIVFKISFSEVRFSMPPYAPLFELTEDGTHWRAIFNLGNYHYLVTDSLYIATFAYSIKVAAVSTLICLAIGYPMAYAIARARESTRNLLLMLIALPFFIPPVITATAWTVMGNPQVGTINLVWRWLTGTNTTIINVYSYFGVIWHMVQYSTPFIFLFIVDAFRAFDPALEESSRMSGASRWQTFKRVTLVLLAPIITSAFILSFMRGVEAFESPLIFGRPADIYVLTTEIYRAINVTGGLPEYQYATALAFSVLLLMFLLVFLQWGILGNRSYQTITGKGYSPGIIKLGKWRWLTFAI